jgi:hypothetical protein
VNSHDDLRTGLAEAVGGTGTGGAAADRLCHACVSLLHVDGASISLVDGGASQGTLGSSDELSKQLDELQFTFGMGPCVDAVRLGNPVLVEDLGAARETRWPAYIDAAVELGVCAVYALPIVLANSCVGALELYRHAAGPLLGDGLTGGLYAAELAALPVLDMLGTGSGDVSEDDAYGWERLAALSRVEVYQATGMLMGQLGVNPPEALIRLRGHAYAEGLTASQVAWEIIERRLILEPDGHRDSSGEAEVRP